MGTKKPNYTTFLQHFDALTASTVHGDHTSRALYLLLAQHAYHIRPVFESSKDQSTFIQSFRDHLVVPAQDMVIWYLLRASSLVTKSMQHAGLED